MMCDPKRHQAIAFVFHLFYFIYQTVASTLQNSASFVAVRTPSLNYD